MESEELSPLATSLTFAEKIYLLLDDLKGLSTLGIIVSSWVIFSIISTFIGYELSMWLNIVFSLIVGLFSLSQIFLGYKMYKELWRWEKSFVRFSYLLKFETYPLAGTNSKEKIFNQLLNVFLRYKELLNDYLEDQAELLNKFLNVKVHGRKEEHVFDVYISHKALEKEKDKRLKELKKEMQEREGSIFIRIFDKTEPVDSKDLKHFGEEINDVLKGTFSEVLKRESLFRILVVSTSSFTENAKKYVKNRRSWVRGKSFDLIEEKPDGYNVIWIS